MWIRHPRLPRVTKAASAKMSGDSRGLGRGLGALLGATPTVSPSRGSGTLPVALMQPGPFQPRQHISPESLEELAASIKTNGVVQPIVVRRLPHGASGVRYEIIAGERRWQAAKLAGLTDIPTIVRELTDRDAVAVALIENIQREDLTAAEEARALQRLATEFDLTHEQVAAAVGRSRAAVSNMIRLLDLPAAVVALIDSKALSMGHARALLGLQGDAERLRMAQLVVARGLSVRETENWVRRLGEGDDTSSQSDSAVRSEILRTSAVSVRLHQKDTGAGKLVVEFADTQSRDVIVGAIRAAIGD
jgi:ParB family transcriptional regulator, chromosome partitioning protein